jgi:hypothetical protein
LFFCLIFAFAYFVLLLRDKDKNKNINENNYKSGYYRGYDAAIAQFYNEKDLRVKIDLNEKVFSYTNQIENKTHLQGYEDGYHKALSSIFCPQ